MVGTRSRAIRGSTSDDRVGCSASEGRYAPARPALHVSPRLSLFLPYALASANCIGPLSVIAPSVNVQSRTRRKPSTLRGAAPDVVIGQSTAAPAGARPYHTVGRDLHGFLMLTRTCSAGRAGAHPDAVWLSPTFETQASSWSIFVSFAVLGRCMQRPSNVARNPSLPNIPFPSSFRVFSRVSRAIIPDRSSLPSVQILFAFFCGRSRACWFKRKPRTPSGGKMKRCQ